MANNNINIVRFNDLPQGGFAGIVEKQMVISPKLMPSITARKDISFGLADFIYLSTGYFKPNDGAPIHPHVDVDIVTLILSGQLAHKGTLGDGTVIHAPGVQVQRAGSGMQHAEYNPQDTQTRFVQIWFLPPQKALIPAYQDIKLIPSKLTTVLGGGVSNDNSGEIFENKMKCQIGMLNEDFLINLDKDFIVYITHGKAVINGQEVTKGDLVQGGSLNLHGLDKFGLVLITKTK